MNRVELFNELVQLKFPTKRLVELAELGGLETKINLGTWSHIYTGLTPKERTEYLKLAPSDTIADAVLYSNIPMVYKRKLIKICDKDAKGRIALCGYEKHVLSTEEVYELALQTTRTWQKKIAGYFNSGLTRTQRFRLAVKAGRIACKQIYFQYGGGMTDYQRRTLRKIIG